MKFTHSFRFVNHVSCGCLFVLLLVS
jgi:hypothetical protein